MPLKFEFEIDGFYKNQHVIYTEVLPLYIILCRSYIAWVKVLWLHTMRPLKLLKAVPILDVNL